MVFASNLINAGKFSDFINAYRFEIILLGMMGWCIYVYIKHRNMVNEWFE